MADLFDSIVVNTTTGLQAANALNKAGTSTEVAIKTVTSFANIVSEIGYYRDGCVVFSKLEGKYYEYDSVNWVETILFFSKGEKKSIVTKVANYSISVDDYTILGNSSGTITFILPSVSDAFDSGIGNIYNIKQINTGTIIVDGDGALIDGESSKSISNKYDNMSIQSDGTSWNIL